MRKVEASIEINSSQEKIISAFTEIEMLKEWWNVERCLIEKKVGGLYTLAWEISETGIRYVSSGIITCYNSDEILIIDHMVYLNPEKPILGPIRLNINLEKEENSVKLNIVQSGYKDGADWDWYYNAVKNAWPYALLQLKEYLEHS